jgi:hypothetical protein
MATDEELHPVLCECRATVSYSAPLALGSAFVRAENGHCPFTLIGKQVIGNPLGAQLGRYQITSAGILGTTAAIVIFGDLSDGGHPSQLLVEKRTILQTWATRHTATLQPLVYGSGRLGDKPE